MYFLRDKILEKLSRSGVYKQGILGKVLHLAIRKIYLACRIDEYFSRYGGEKFCPTYGVFKKIYRKLYEVSKKHPNRSWKSTF